MLAAKKYLLNARDCVRKNAYGEALVLLEEGLIHYPDNVFLLTSAGDLYSKTREHGRAKILLTKAHRLDPGDVKTLTSLGVCLSWQGELTEAKRVLNIARKLAPTDIRVVMPLGFIHIGQKAYSVFDTLVERTMDLGKSDITYVFMLTKKAFFNSELERARQLCKEGMQLGFHKGLVLIYFALTPQDDPFRQFLRRDMKEKDYRRYCAQAERIRGDRPSLDIILPMFPFPSMGHNRAATPSGSDSLRAVTCDATDEVRLTALVR